MYFGNTPISKFKQNTLYSVTNITFPSSSLLNSSFREKYNFRYDGRPIGISLLTPFPDCHMAAAKHIY